MYDIFTYRRPQVARETSGDSASRSPTTTTTTTKSKTASQGSGGTSIFGIPEALSFDRVIENGTCPPVTCRDFMKYLLYVEHGAENLQFYLWFRDYTSRFKQLPEREKVLSPEYTLVSESAEVSRPHSAVAHTNVKPDQDVQQFIAKVFTDNNLNQQPSIQSMKTDPFSTPPHTPVSGKIAPYGFDGPIGDTCIDHEKVARDAFAAVEAAQPFTIQPFRDEINRIISVYLAEGTPRELNLPFKDRDRALKALSKTTHPSALEHINSHIEDLLRFQSHPNFIRWSIGNGNRPRAIFAISLGVATTIIGFIIAVLLTLSGDKRGFRALAAIPWVIGIATIWAGMKGMCVLLHGLHRRHMRPWELWSDSDNGNESGESKISFEDSLGGKNSYEDEPWIKQYDNRMLIRKIFDREVWIEEPALRKIQDTIAIQGLLIGIVISAILSAIFLVLPHGRFY